MSYEELDQLFDRLWPICRSVTGPGITESLRMIKELMPIEIREIPSGTQVFDWVIPKEWELDRATLRAIDGSLVLDTNVSNLHVLNFSEPFSGVISFSELNAHLHSNPEVPEAIPYTTSYYAENWGFCLSENQRKSLNPDTQYEVSIKTKKVDGHLRFGECFLQGLSDKVILISSYLCHPSMANNELSGPLALVALYDKLRREENRKFSYRFVLGPETIGSISFLSTLTESELSNICGGVVLTCLGGDAEKLSFKHSRRQWVGQDSPIDEAVARICEIEADGFESRDFDPCSGSDERQYCSPAFNLPVVQVARTIYGQYREYHTDLDNKAFMQLSKVVDSVEKIFIFLKFFELESFRLFSIDGRGEPMLSKRGLYPTVHSARTRRSSTDDSLDGRESLNTLLQIISLADGTRRLSDISAKLDISYNRVRALVELLILKEVLKLE